MVSLKLRGPRRPGSSGGGRATRSKTPAETKRSQDPKDEDMDDSISVHRPPSPVPAKSAKAPKSKAADPSPKPSPIPAAGTGKAKADIGDITTAVVQDSKPSNSTPPVSSNGKGLRKRTLAEANAESMPPPPLSRPSSSKGKAPAREVEQANGGSDMTDDDGEVEEYDFSNEPEEHESDYDDDLQDTEAYKRYPNNPDNVITISSDDEIEERWPPWDLRPWNKMDEDARRIWETMYCETTFKSIDGDWNWTEDFQAEKDKEMLRYLEDFPTPQWVLSKAMAVAAKDSLEKRLRWRNVGIPIYEKERRAGWYPPTGSFHSYSESYVLPLHQQPNGNVPYNGQGPPNGMAPHQPPYNVPPQPTNGFVPSQPPHDSRYPPNHGCPKGPPVPQPPHVMSGALPSDPMRQPGPMGPPLIGDAASQNGKGKGRATIPSAPSGQPAPPPYPIRERPGAREVTNKSRRKSTEVSAFPWNRPMDFMTARSSATWDDGIYDPKILDNMIATRRHNVPVIDRIDFEEIERQRKSRAARKAANMDGALSETLSDGDGEKSKAGSKSSVPSGAEGTIGDAYHSGHYTFVTPEDEEKASKLFGAKHSPDEIITAAAQGEVIDYELCKDMMIIWNPGKKSHITELQQACFSIKDTLLTRRQLDRTPILTRRAAECIVDFCPDMLWRGSLLRIASEAGYGNKDVRDRMCLNGNYCDKATITKRIDSALGQKQAQTAKSRMKDKDKDGQQQSIEVSEKMKSTQYAKGEDEYYNQNVIDFGQYVDFFGHRVSHRRHLSLRKRKAIHLDSEDTGDDSSDAESLRPVKNGSGSSAQSPAIISSDPPAGAVEIEDEDMIDAVSVQSDTILDEMDDD